MHWADPGDTELLERIVRLEAELTTLDRWLWLQPTVRVLVLLPLIRW